MSSPYFGEIRMFAGNFAPLGWALCQGQLLPIDQNDTLFNLIGTTYGGDGQTTFALPDLRSRVPIHMGTGPDGTTFQIGEQAGVETVTLTASQLPAHTHAFLGSQNPGGTTNPPANVVAQIPGGNAYIEDVATVALAPASIGSAGGNQPHDNMVPFLVINFIISLVGPTYPSPT